MRASCGCAAAALLALLSATPAGALRPASLDGAARGAEASPAQFRFPWEAKPPKRKPRPKKSTRSSKPRAERPAAAGRRDEPRRPSRPAAARDPKDAPLPPLAVPLGLLPRGGTEREADGWTAIAGQLGEPAAVPLLPPEGPAPAPANVVALLSGFRAPAPTAPPPAADQDDDDETPDLHVPLPPVRPGAPSAGRRPVDGLAPEGGGLSRESGLAPEGAGLAPDGPPLPTPRDERRAALEPEVPLPPEPPPGPTPPAIPLPVTTHAEDPACGVLADKAFAAAEEIPPIEGPGVCGSGPLVLLSGVKRKDGGLVAVKPAATLRCAMAKELADYLRDDLAPAAEASGAKLERLDIAGSFMCRGRNGAAGGRMSEHGRANAVDLSGFGFADGRRFGVFASDLPEPFKAAAKTGACAHFDTVLGPGSDGFHESHLHVDLQPRRSKAKLCQWSEPPVAKAREDDADGAKDDTAGAGPADAGKPKDGSAETETAARRKADRAEEPLPKRDKTP